MHVRHSNNALVCNVSRIYASKSRGCCIQSLLIALHPVIDCSVCACLSVCLSVCLSARLPLSFSALFCALIFSPAKTRFRQAISDWPFMHEKFELNMYNVAFCCAISFFPKLTSANCREYFSILHSCRLTNKARNKTETKAKTRSSNTVRK